MRRPAWPVNFKIPFLHLASPRGPGVRDSASWPTHAGSPSLPIVLAWALRARGEGARLRSEGSRPPRHAQEGVCGLGRSAVRAQRGRSGFSPFSFPRKRKRPLFLNFLEGKPEENIVAKERASGGAQEAASHAPRGCTQSPASRNFQGNPAACPCKQRAQPLCCDPHPRPQAQPGPTNPDL